MFSILLILLGCWASVAVMRIGFYFVMRSIGRKMELSDEEILDSLSCHEE